MFDILQTLSNGCSVGSGVSCITLSFLWVVLIAGTVNVLCTLLRRHDHEEEEEEKK